MAVKRMGAAAAAALPIALAFAATPASARELRHRTIAISDTSGPLPVVHVAPGFTTVLAFQASLRDAAFVRAVGAQFEKLGRTDRTVVVLPNQVVNRPVTLNVAMADGTILAFALVTVPRKVDAQVDVTVALRTAPDSPEALKAQIASLRRQLEECQGMSDRASAGRVAALILAQGLEAPQAFETHALSAIDKQDRLLVEARRVYRLLGLTYVVLSLDNRDPQRTFVLGEPVVRLEGGPQEVELAVVAHAADLPELPPDKQERVVVAFKIPHAVKPGARFSIALTERDGTRRAELTGLEL